MLLNVFKCWIIKTVTDGLLQPKTVCEWRTNILQRSQCLEPQTHDAGHTAVCGVCPVITGSCLSLSVVLNSHHVTLLPCVVCVLPPPLRFFSSFFFFFESTQTKQLRLHFQSNDANNTAGSLCCSLQAADCSPIAIFSRQTARCVIMDTDYSSGLENPLYSELKYFCRKIQEAYNELKEDLTPYRDDRFYRWVSCLSTNRSILSLRYSIMAVWR